MNIEDFYAKFKINSLCSIDSICELWEKEKEVHDFLGMEISSGVMVADLLIGDGSLDQVSPTLRVAFEGLMKEKADSYSKIHQILLEKLDLGDKSVWGMVNKIKGQIGEEIFKETCAKEGISATLASSGSQEGWDVAIDQGDGITQYVQVKMYSNPNKVIEKIKEVQEKVDAGIISGDDGAPVTSIDFAVPKDIALDVEAKLDELGINIKILPINSTADEVAGIVQEGFDNMGPEAMGNFFGELLGSTVSTAAIHAITNAFLVYKGSKASAAFISETIKSSSISAIGFASGMSVEMILNQIAWIGGPPTTVLVFATSFSTRAIAKRILKRGESTEWVMNTNNNLIKMTERIQAL
ncbi:MAG: hypothetical protein AB7E04_10530 [Desulfobacteraceae bacterium]